MIFFVENEPNKMSKENEEIIGTRNFDDLNANDLDQSNIIFKPLPLKKRGCGTCKSGNCNCDKKGNCKCGYQLSNMDENIEKNLPNEKTISDMDFSLPGDVNFEEKSIKEDADMKESETNSDIKSNNKLRTPRKLKDSFHFTDGEYFIDQHPLLYRLTPVDGLEKFRNLLFPKNEDESGTHLYAIKQRMVPHSRFRRRTQTENNQPIQLIDMSAEDLFGALPQSYEGELARYKRVKRARKRK